MTKKPVLKNTFGKPTFKGYIMKVDIKKPFDGINISKPYLFVLGDKFSKVNTDATALVRSIKFNDKEVNIKFLLDEENKFESFLNNNKIITIMILSRACEVTKTFKLSVGNHWRLYPEYIAHDAVNEGLIVATKFSYTLQ